MRTRKRLPVRRRLKNKRRKRLASRKKYKFKGGVQDERLNDVDFKCELKVEEEYPKFKGTDLLIDYIFSERSANGNKPIIVGTGSLRTDPSLKVFVKLCPSYEEDNYQALRYESCVYDNIKRLKMCNVVKKIYTATIKGDGKMFNPNNPYFTPESLAKIEGLYTKVYPKPPDLDKEDVDYFLLFTIKSGTMTLEDAFKKKILLNEKQFKAIIFQVAFSLCKLHKAGIQHNDLHFGNILIDTNAVGSIEYTVGLPSKEGIENVTFVVPIDKCRVLLYDWDLGLAECGLNYYLEEELCPNYGVCNDLNIKFDFYTFMRGFDKYMKHYLNPEFTKFHNEMIKHLIDEKYDMRMCNLNKDKNRRNPRDCIPFGKDEPLQVISPYEALQNKYFDEFNEEKNLNNDDEYIFSV